MYNPKHFANKGHEKDYGEFGAEDRALIKTIRGKCPELSDWGDLPIGIAWGSYSQDVYLISWLEESQASLNRQKLVEFLAYIWWHEVNGEPNWGLTPEELSDFASNHSII